MVPPAPSPLFAALAEYVGVTEEETQAWWAAVRKARWSAAQDWRCTIVYFDAQPHRIAKLDALRALLDTTASARTLVQVIEALVAERLLARPVASAIEAAILAKVDREGNWY